jgi:hypothetical protein
MSYLSQVFNVMIASPSDVRQERVIAQEVIYEWNAAHSDSKKIVLRPLGLESDASPELGDRPQEIINRQILARSDLLVAIFWTRLGSPTGKAVSGTVEEIKQHLSAGKVVMLYFSSAPVPPDRVDLEQLSSLKKFRQEIYDRGLIETFQDAMDFRRKFSRHLAIKINCNRGVFHPHAGSNVPLPTKPDQNQPTRPPPSSKAKQPLLSAHRSPSDFIHEAKLTPATFSRLVGIPHRTVHIWMQRGTITDERGVVEAWRLFSGLTELVPVSEIAVWLESPNPAFDGLTPLQVIEQGESDRIWQVIWELRTAGKIGS